MKRRVFVRTFVLGTGGVMVRKYNLSAAGDDHDTILVKMIYNNTGNHPDFKKEWGLAMWIEDNKHAILFDTGGNSGTLWKNIQAAGIDLSKLSDEQIQAISVNLKEMQVQKIAPSHCTGDKAIEFFRSEWKDRFIDFNIGDDYKI